jgi:hypothetical protein
MRRYADCALLLSVLLGCGGGEGERGGDPSHPRPEATEETSPAAEDPPPAEATPATIRVLNDTDEAVTLDRSFGPAEPLGIRRLDGELDPTAELDEQDDERSGGWVSTCECACGDDPCPECEPPPTVQVELEPGEAYELPWNGRLKRHREHPGGGICYESFAPPRGRYLVTACTTEGRCGRAEVTLPASETIEVRLSNAATATACSDVSPEAMERAGAGLIGQLRHVLRERPLDRCPDRPRCVAPGEIQGALREAHDEPCSLFVVPRGHEIEAILLAPLPDGYVGGEQFRHWLDPDATRVLRARFEQ